MQGGFKDGWLKEDLPTVQDTVYRRGTVKVVADRAELVASQIGAPELATIARVSRERAEEPGINGVVVTHGTDT